MSLSGQQSSLSGVGKLRLPSSCTLLLGDRGLTRSEPATNWGLSAGMWIWL